MGKKTVLVVDFAPFMRQMLKSILESTGLYEVLEAEDGDKALMMNIQQKFDLIFIRINMPYRDGVDILREIKGVDPQAKAIVYTQLRGDEQIVSAIHAGAVDFFEMPFKRDVIIEMAGYHCK